MSQFPYTHPDDNHLLAVTQQPMVQPGVAPQSASSECAVEGWPMAASTWALPLGRDRKEHTSAEWELIRPHFTQLYIAERRRLADVSRILQDEYGFHATDKQYKDRIRKWGLKKNFKDSEKREALVTGVDAQSGSLVAFDGAAIPRRRLKRFAREEKLLYVRRMAAGVDLPGEPELTFDVVIELPRSLFERRPNSDDRALHEAFADVDLLTKRRSPILAFEVIGVSDKIVRYGLRRLERKMIPCVAFQTTAPQVRHGKQHGLGLRFCALAKACAVSYQVAKVPETHVALYHTIHERFYQACQNIYAPDNRSRMKLAQKPGEAPDLHCVKFDGSAEVAQRLFMRVLVHSILSGGVRYNGPMHDGGSEVIASPETGLSARIVIGPQKNLLLTIKPALNVAMHMIFRNGLVAGGISFRPGYEGLPFFSAGELVEREGMRIASILQQPEGDVKTLVSPAESPQTTSSGPFLTEGDAVEQEFAETYQRAASRAGPVQPIKQDVAYSVATNEMLESNPAPGPQSDWATAVAEHCLVDRKEPWKPAQIV